MEPGHEDREYTGGRREAPSANEPQWSPAMKTGNTARGGSSGLREKEPQWSPAMKTGNTWTVTWSRI